ncbi:MAG: hypothetical protein WC492_01255 [Candidatus Micrarchaeia archaeon]
MSNCTISKSTVSGNFTPPASIPLAWRALWCASIGQGGAFGNCPTHSDIKAILRLGGQLGADITVERNTVDILAEGLPFPSELLTCSLSSRASRVAFPLAAIFDSGVKIKEFKIAGSALSGMDSIALDMGVRITKTPDEIFVSGPQIKTLIPLDNRAGAYWASGLMMALPLSQQASVLAMDDFVRIHPSVINTFEILTLFGIDYSFQTEEGTMTISPYQAYPARYVDIPACWREGSYYLGAFVLCGKGEVALSWGSNQPEREFWKIIFANKQIAFSSDGQTIIAKSSLPLSLPPMIDPRPFPSLIPLMMLFATQSSKSTKIGPLVPISAPALASARIMAAQLNRLGAKITFEGSHINIPYSPLSGGIVDSQKNGRVAMALGLAGLIAKSPVKIANADASDKYNKNFWQDLKTLGANVKIG